MAGKFKRLNRFKLAVICAITAILSCSVSYADNSDFFYPIPSDSLASGPIYLDSSLINKQLLQNNLPSPSEYSSTTIPADVFTPVDNTPPVLERSYTPEQAESNEVEPADTPQSPFAEINNIAPPSEYKPTVKFTHAKKESPPKSQADTYVSSAVEESYDFSDMEGKPISSIKISGLNRISEKTVLSAMKVEKGSLFNAQRLQMDLQSIYNLGYFTESMQIDPVLNKNKTVSLEFILEENPEVKNVEILGNTVFAQDELLSLTDPLKNMPQNINLINEVIEKIDKHYEENGYILARVTNVDDTADGTLKLEISEGIIEKIVFEGEHKTKDYVIERNIMSRPGTVYNEEMFKKDVSRIYATQIFENVDRKLIPSTDKEGQYILSISVKENSSNGITVGGGLDNALGVFGSLSIWEKNFLGKGQYIGVSGMIGSGTLLSDASIKNRINYNVELVFKEPHFINADNSLMSKIYFRELGSYQVPLAIERRLGFNGNISHKVQGKENLTTNLGLGYENIHLREGDYTQIASMYALRGLDIKKREQQLTGGDFVNIAPGIKYSNIDNEFMPRDGLIAQANFVESLAVNNMKNTHGKLVGNITKYIPVFEKSTLAIGAKGGIKVHGDDMPEVMAFRLGGPYTIRGFRMNGVGSGESYLMGSAELQTPIPFMDKFKYDFLKNLRLAFFVDAGKLWNPTISSTLYDRPNYAITAGVGIRVNIPGMGPISVDYGLPLTNVGSCNKQHGYVTFGTGGLYDSY